MSGPATDHVAKQRSAVEAVLERRVRAQQVFWDEYPPIDGLICFIAAPRGKKLDRGTAVKCCPQVRSKGSPAFVIIQVGRVVKQESAAAVSARCGTGDPRMREPSLHPFIRGRDRRDLALIGTMSKPVAIRSQIDHEAHRAIVDAVRSDT
ncbi:MAG: hypothetical protein HBSAPP03_25450 [Phycisphaerae bacterium]|jgi:hypothetical protein|nr:MAG: hypothetical protein HBSAPP03_25450 [Phycisphaerae bacterium]